MKGVDFFDPRETILREVSQERIMSYYLGLPIDLNRSFSSPLRDDKKPGCSFWYSKTGVLYFHDFAISKMYNWVDIVRSLFGLSYPKAIEKVRRDLPVIREHHADYKDKDDVELTVVLSTERSSYWDQYGIGDETLARFGVHSVKSVYRDGELSKRSTTKNPIFAYLFPSGRLKLYRPYGDKDKWGGNSTVNDIGGLQCFPQKATLTFITSSIKDAMVLYELGFSAVCMNGEGYGVNPMSESYKVFADLLRSMRLRSKYVLLFLDSDEAGLTFAQKLDFAHGRIPFMYTPKEKDISDYRKKYGYHKTMRMLKKLLSKKFKITIDAPY